MTLEELKAEARRRLDRDFGPALGSTPQIRFFDAESCWTLEVHSRMTLDERPFVSWTSTLGYPDTVRNVVWHFDEIGQPDLSFKGINKFKGRWEGETA